jgi:hypothetical protein
MIKHFFAMLIISMVVIFFEGWSWLKKAFMSVIAMYNKLEVFLHGLLPGGAMVHRAESLLLMLVVPLLITGAIAIVYYVFKKRFMPEFMTVTWLFWSLLVVMLSLTKLSVGY